jgi:hypothetical protein
MNFETHIIRRKKWHELQLFVVILGVIIKFTNSQIAHSQEGVLDDQMIYAVMVMSEEKPNQQEQIKFKRENIRKYFPKSYTDKQVCDTVIKLLQQWQCRWERDRDSR